MSSREEAVTKPCRLELNNSGAWKLMARFDAANTALATPEARTLPDWRLDELAGALYLCITDSFYAQTVSAPNRIAEINTLVCNALRAAGYDTVKSKPMRLASLPEATAPVLPVQGARDEPSVHPAGLIVVPSSTGRNSGGA